LLRKSRQLHGLFTFSVFTHLEEGLTMRAIAALALLALVAVPAFAGEGNVPPATLSSLGLGDLEVMSDTQGMEVRGQASSFAAVRGSSLIFGQLMTADTKNFVVGSSGNQVEANAETTAAGGALTVAKSHGVTLNLGLNLVFPDLTQFVGSILGSASGTGSVSAIQP
jgi:hypothetical protein